MRNRQPRHTVATTLATPMGAVRIAATHRGVCRMNFVAVRQADSAARRTSAPPRRGLSAGGGRMAPADSASARQAQEHLQRAARQLKEYFAGRRKTFDLALDLQGTAHQRRVWRALLEIPFGQTLSYGQVARQLGTPGSARAVGHACASNPVWLVVPCHRVIASDGGLHGYGGGLWRKQRLLEWESGK